MPSSFYSSIPAFYAEEGGGRARERPVCKYLIGPCLELMRDVNEAPRLNLTSSNFRVSGLCEGFGALKYSHSCRRAVRGPNRGFATTILTKSPANSGKRSLAWDRSLWSAIDRAGSVKVATRARNTRILTSVPITRASNSKKTDDRARKGRRSSVGLQAAMPNMIRPGGGEERGPRGRIAPIFDRPALITSACEQ